MCRAYRKSFRKSVLFSVSLIGVYAVSSAVLSGYGSFSPFHQNNDKGYFERESSQGWRQRNYKEDSSRKETSSHGEVTDHLERSLSHGEKMEAFKKTLSPEKIMDAYKQTLSDGEVTETVHEATSVHPETLVSISSPSSPPAKFPWTQSSSIIQSQSTSSPVITKPQKKATRARVLLTYDKDSLDSAKEIRTLLQSHRIVHDTYLYNNQYLLPLESEGKGHYCAIIIIDVCSLYKNWVSAHRWHLFDHVRNFDVTLIHFVNGNTGTPREFKISDLVVWLADDRDLVGINLNKDIDFYYLKTEETITQLPSNTTYAGVFLRARDWSVKEDFEENVKTRDGLRVLAEMKFKRRMRYRGEDSLPLVVAGEWEAGMNQVMVGTPANFWLTKLLLLEVLRSYVGSHSLARFGRERLVMVDIDDIFVAPRGLKMTSSDVEALRDTQEAIRDLVPGFTFNLGMCGKFYLKGSDADVNGSRSLVEHKDDFWWFGHTYNHYQVHLMANRSVLTDDVEANMEFAKNMSLPITENSYAVSPHHSGIYPVYDMLYRVWRNILNVSVTSTEEYPHMYPFQKRRGFIHRGIRVLPRQTCRLFTHNYNMSNFPGGWRRLDRLAQGGEVFNYLLNAPVIIYMTHNSNYARDRLAPYLFMSLFKFASRWTKLEISGAPPLTLAHRYFSIFPEDRVPTWTSPCRDRRHLDMWHPRKTCSRLPDVLVLGPQKTGTSALHLFLRHHPNVSVNFSTKDHFEEMQFFSDSKLYSRGINWYMDQFPHPTESTQILFEKSATYFNHFMTPIRVHHLLPDAKLIVILHDPIRRAYSWYQHKRAHKDPTAINHTFMEVLHANGSSSPELLHLKLHCLDPGNYHRHILRWMAYIPLRQMWFVDGVKLQLQPVSEMNKLQHFLELSFVNYSSLVRYNWKKRHFCAVSNGKFDCLGPSKGRRYRVLQPDERAWLHQYYSRPNLQLMNVLMKQRRPLPLWLINSRVNYMPVKQATRPSPG